MCYSVSADLQSAVSVTAKLETQMMNYRATCQAQTQTSSVLTHMHTQALSLTPTSTVSARGHVPLGLIYRALF